MYIFLQSCFPNVHTFHKIAHVGFMSFLVGSHISKSCTKNYLCKSVMCKVEKSVGGGGGTQIAYIRIVPDFCRKK